MSAVVLDTDVVSFLFKNDTRAGGYLRHLRDRRWLISFMTEAELEQWALLSNWHAKRIEWFGAESADRSGDQGCVKIAIRRSAISFTFAWETCPARYATIVSSAVNNLLGRILLL